MLKIYWMLIFSWYFKFMYIFFKQMRVNWNLKICQKFCSFERRVKPILILNFDQSLSGFRVKWILIQCSFFTALHCTVLHCTALHCNVNIQSTIVKWAVRMRGSYLRWQPLQLKEWQWCVCLLCRSWLLTNKQHMEPLNSV